MAAWTLECPDEDCGFFGFYSSARHPGFHTDNIVSCPLCDEEIEPKPYEPQKGRAKRVLKPVAAAEVEEEAEEEVEVDEDGEVIDPESE